MNALARIAAGVLAGVGALAAAGEPVRPCEIRVVDRDGAWPVPLVELRTTHRCRFVTDNAGRIAFDLPELMGTETFFHVRGHGYGVRKDGFGQRGVRLTPRPGGKLEVRVRRASIARRLGRLTGGGLFAESRKLGHDVPGPAAPGGVLGCDSVQLANHRGRLFWLWGDTTLARYPLGVFHSTAAWTPPAPLARSRPPVRIAYDIFTGDDGRARAVAKMPGEGPTWLSGVVSLPAAEGRPRLLATYVKITPPLTEREKGLCVWGDDAERFERLTVLWTRSDRSDRPPAAPHGHATRWTDAHGRKWVLFGNPLPTLRCRATFEAWRDPDAWEHLTPQETIPAAGTDRAVTPHTGSIAFSGFRKRWVTVFMEKFGKPSAFGELWYAEADAPIGPWGPAVKVLSHENYTFYNPRLHPELTDADSPVLLFEGTYTAQFADDPTPTPRYDYNQVLYRLDLDDPALTPARRTATPPLQRPCR